MDREERKRLKEKKRLMRRQQKEFIAEERRSIRRQKKEERLERAWQRKKYRKERLHRLKRILHKAIHFLSGKSGSKTASSSFQQVESINVQPAPSIFPEPKKIKLHHQPTDLNEEKHLQHDKRKLLKRQKKEFKEAERRSVKRERQEQKRQISMMRKKMNAARIEGMKHDFKEFLKHPVKQDEIDETDKRILKKIRREIRQQNYRRLMMQPKFILSSISRFWRNRFDHLNAGIERIISFVRLIKSAFSQKQMRNDYIKTAVNSIGLFLLSFLLVYYVHQFATIFTARAFNIPTKLYSYRIDWPLYTYSYLYSRKALIVIFGMGPILCLLMGIGAYRLFLLVRFRTVFLKSFLLWTAFHAFNLFFGAYIVGVITRTGFVYTSEWLFLSNVFDVEEIIFMITSIIILLISGYYSTKQFLYATDSAAIIEPRFRIIYLISKVLIPWLSGTLILFAVNIPKNPLELIMLYGTSSLIIFPIFTNYNTTMMKMLKLPHTLKKVKIGWVYILITVIVIIATRMLLRSGISFN